MTIQAAHQAALEKGDKANTRAVYGSTGFKGVNATPITDIAVFLQMWPI